MRAEELKFNMRALRLIGKLTNNESLSSLHDLGAIGLCKMTEVLIVAGSHGANPDNPLIPLDNAATIVDNMSIQDANKIVDAFIAAVQAPENLPKGEPGREQA